MMVRYGKEQRHLKDNSSQGNLGKVPNEFYEHLGLRERAQGKDGLSFEFLRGVQRRLCGEGGTTVLEEKLSSGSSKNMAARWAKM